MDFRLVRHTFTSKSTVGRLYSRADPASEWVFEAFTLEDVERNIGTSCDKKIAGKTCIPVGTYGLRMTFSKRFQRRLPQLLDVPCFEGIRIHAGNTDADTEGCILVGKTRDADFVGMSKDALASLLPKIEAAGQTSIEIVHLGG